MSFSNGSGGTLTLPSPTHVHHVDMSSAVRSLRRSISRSPSKFSLGRTNSQSSESSQHSGHSIPSPQSPCRQYITMPSTTTSSPAVPALTNTQTQPQAHCRPAPTSSTPSSSISHASFPASSFSTPFKPSVKLSLRSAKASKTAPPPPRPRERLRASPKSPLKRALSVASDAGNSTPSSNFDAPGQENSPRRRPLSPLPRKSFERPYRHSLHLDVSGAAQHSLFKSLETVGSDMATPGALKRSDATMDLDVASHGSPVAKRRSLHGISSLGPVDLNIFTSNGGFASPSLSFTIHDDTNQEYELSGAAPATHREPLPSPTPNLTAARRSASLRKSTLQQRQVSWGRRVGAQQLAQMAGDMSTPVKNRQRLSMDSFVPPEAPRESAVSSSSPIQSLSIHSGPVPQGHPLRRSVKLSALGNHLQDDAIDAVPAAPLDKSRVPQAFSQSLPYGVSAPIMSTPKFCLGDAYPARGVVSTGLVSKVNRHPELESKKLIMPETPCKKPGLSFATYPGGSVVKNVSPATPSNPIFRQSRGTFGKGMDIFRSRTPRRGSILTAEVEDRMPLVDRSGDVIGSSDGDLPPSPTKEMLSLSANNPSNLSEQSIDSPSAIRSFQPPLSAVRPAVSRESSCKYTTIPERADYEEEDDDDAAPRASDLSTPLKWEPPPILHHPLPSLSRSRAVRGLTTPSPLRPRSLLPHARCSKKLFAKIDSLDPASPVEGRHTPHTPREGISYLDASRLSISQLSDSSTGTRDGARRNSMPPPVTPTTGRDHFRNALDNRAVTPMNGKSLRLEPDADLLNRFDNVEFVGQGEFSKVYRVTKFPSSSVSFLTAFTATPVKRNTPGSEAVYAVKMSRRAYQGEKDRERKLREVRVLKALVHAEHVVHYFDSWEYLGQLYIQTEFCEEGTLDLFLNMFGPKGRLDDFRTWKILQDLSLGVQAIHDAGFIHLDLKPDNVLIDSEGVLKIGDFGLATAWPAPKGTDAEGDRRYMGPEILCGQFDKPADIFSLGLMTLEIACNVVIPDNGPTYLKMRSGDFSDIPRIASERNSEILRDATGVPVKGDQAIATTQSEPLMNGNESTGRMPVPAAHGDYFRTQQPELQPPRFMIDAAHHSSLDMIIRWMLSPEPSHRPTIGSILTLEGLHWVGARRRAAATVYEGNWGPVNDGEDTEMVDILSH